MADPSLFDKVKEAGKSLVPEAQAVRGNAENINAYVNSNKPAPTPKPASTSSAADRVNPKAKYGDRPGEKRIDVSDMVKPLKSYKQGTTHVPETGTYKLHEGEAVIPADKNPFSMVPGMPAEKPAKKIDHIRTRKGKSGGYIHEHHHTHPEHHPMEQHVSGNQDGMVGHMLEHMGEPNPGEAEADAGQSGIPSGAPGQAGQ